MKGQRHHRDIYKKKRENFKKPQREREKNFFFIRFIRRNQARNTITIAGDTIKEASEQSVGPSTLCKTEKTRDLCAFDSIETKEIEKRKKKFQKPKDTNWAGE